MNPQNILLISFGHFERDFLETIAESINHEYGYSVAIEESHMDLTRFYDPARKQYDGNKLLKEIDVKHTSKSLKTVGIFRVDIFIPILTFIYGQAFLNGNSSIASLFRLNNERYGIPRDENLLLERFRKEVIHELGHSFGLRHCYSPTCVMNPSTYVEDIDQKSAELCTKCRLEIEHNIINT